MIIKIFLKIKGRNLIQNIKDLLLIFIQQWNLNKKILKLKIFKKY